MGGLGINGKTHIQENVLQRLKIARGHLEKVIEMVGEKKYCIDIINQSKAVQHALKEIDYILLENHLQTCVVDFVKKGKTQKSIEEIMRIFKNNK